jgi:S-methylmethionine-dependent homocysteine/selenocysteine methylase
MNQLPSEGRTVLRLEAQADNVAGIYAVCINCNKRFTSMRAVSMHLKGTANRHAVIFSNHGNYDKKTGLRTNDYHPTNIT